MALAIRRIPASEFARDALVELYIELLSESEIQAGLVEVDTGVL